VHEFSLADDIFREVLAVAAQHGLRQVTEVKLLIGRLAGVSIEALEYAWSFMRSNDPHTAAAELAITLLDGCGKCEACGFAGGVETHLRICPACGAPGLRFTAGEEFMLAEVSGEPAPAP
jgi:hydrogenase nickel incorporation protein HypA/HybF